MSQPSSGARDSEIPREPSGSWSRLIQQSSDPIFLLSRRRQVRFVNRAWETISGKSAEFMRGLFCLPLKKKGTGPLRALLQTLAPPPEVLDGRTASVRRPVPPCRVGPPWWDITFVPLLDAGKLAGILGFIRVEQERPGPAGGGGLNEALAALRQKTAARFSFDLLASESPAMQRVEAQARLAARTQMPVWIAGEAGSGKETLARVIHFQGSNREQTFLCLDCLALQPFLLRSMLFGHVGQTGERLGTLFIKDPGSMPRDLQSELLDWLDDQEAPPRLIVASRDENKHDVRSGRLVPAFEAALNLFEIKLPPLRERLVDLPVLIRDIFQRQSLGEAPREVSTAALDLLARHSWPGNLRELADVLRQAAAAGVDASASPGTGVGASGGEPSRIDSKHLPLYLRSGNVPTAAAPLKLESVLAQVEARLVRLALQRAKGNKSAAAEWLGISRGSLLRRIEQLRIEGPSG